MSRPPLPDHERRTVNLTVRLTEGEAADLTTRAAELGLAAGPFLREAALARRLPSPPVPELNRTAWADLSKLASNLNQLARLAHAGQLADVGPEILDDLANQVQALRRELLGLAD